MKKIYLFLTFFIFQFCNYQVSAQCSRGALVVAGDSLIQGGCTINGDVTILNNGILEVDMTGVGLDTFIVRGNILLQGNAQLTVHADSGSTGKIFIVSNAFNSQRSITQQGNSKIILQNIEFRTQEGDLSNAGSISMNCYSKDSAQFFAQNTFLDVTKAWLLHNLNNQSSLVTNNTTSVPTEIYIYDSTNVQIVNNSATGLWLDFDSACTLNLPLQNGSNYNWQAGSGTGGLNTHWLVSVVNAAPGLGVLVEPNAQLTVNGHGTPTTGEIHVSMFFASSNKTLSNLHVGLQNGTVDNRLTFNNVNLGPIGWQLYVLYNDTLNINNSTVNEIGVAGPGSQANVDSSVLQLAVLAAIGANSSLTVNNSSAWNQAIEAANNSKVTLNNCAITGSMLDPYDTGSSIIINNCCFYPNPSGCTEGNMVDIATGLPNCDPFRPAGVSQSSAGTGRVIETGTGNCTSGVNDIKVGDGISAKAFPNPFSSETEIVVTGIYGKYDFELYDITGRLIKTMPSVTDSRFVLDRGDLAGGVYVYAIVLSGTHVAYGKVVVR